MDKTSEYKNSKQIKLVNITKQKQTNRYREQLVVTCGEESG